jgi:UDP-N-acetylglucosamine:LPS N-acetylglucosamine transferase
VVVPEHDLARVPDLVVGLLADGERLAAMGDAMRRAAKPHAADEVAEELIGLATA